MLYLNRPSIHDKYIQGVIIRCRKHMCFSDVKSYIRKQSRKLGKKTDKALEKTSLNSTTLILSYQ